jgi:predicted TIM-barrel fold metal-dependent hydrolase
VLEQLRRLYFDTALVMNAPSLAALTAFAAPSRILLGTDAPFLPIDETISGWETIELGAEVRARIEHENAAALLCRFNPV